MNAWGQALEIYGQFIAMLKSMSMSQTDVQMSVQLT